MKWRQWNLRLQNLVIFCLRSPYFRYAIVWIPGILSFINNIHYLIEPVPAYELKMAVYQMARDEKYLHIKIVRYYVMQASGIN
jgi:hypothetical protein